MDQSDTFPWSRYGIGCPGCWGLRVNPEYLPGFRKELRSYEWHDVFTCQIWTTWRPNRCGSIGTCQWPVTSFWLLLEQPLRNHALLPASVETAWGKVVLIRLVWLDLYLGSASTSSSSSLSPSPSPPSSSVIHLNPYIHLRSIRHPTPTPAESAPNKNRPPSLASKKRCNENNGQQECAKPGLGVFHEAQQVRL